MLTKKLFDYNNSRNALVRGCNMDKLQNEIDIKKWLDSEKAKRDLCGNYLFCKYCDKSLANPCASAYKKMKSDSESKPIVNKPTTSKPVNKKEKKSSKYHRLTFEDKINRADDETRQVLQEIVESIETDEIKATIYKRFMSIKYNHRLCAWISFNRKSLKVHLPLNPNSFVEYKPMNYSEIKTYLNNPYTLKLDTQRSKKAICILVNKVVKSIKEGKNTFIVN